MRKTLLLIIAGALAAAGGSAASCSSGGTGGGAGGGSAGGAAGGAAGGTETGDADAGLCDAGVLATCSSYDDRSAPDAGRTVEFGTTDPLAAVPQCMKIKAGQTITINA